MAPAIRRLARLTIISLGISYCTYLTELIYFQDSYVSQFDARATEVRGTDVILDRTAFYPEGGGQPSDTGTLAGGSRIFTVTHVRKSGPAVLHTVSKPGIGPGEGVHGEIDWERRYEHMRYHTAQHLLSAHFLDRYGARTTGNRISADRGTIDFDIPRLSPEMVRGTEDRMNRWIELNIPVTIRMMDRSRALAELDQDRTRVDRLPKTVKELRIVSIEGIDEVACAGTHVRETGELVGFRVDRTRSKGKKRKRLEFVLDRS